MSARCAMHSVWLGLALLSLCACGYFDPLNPPRPTTVDTSVSWEKSIGGDGEDCATSVLALSDGGFVFTGWTTSKGAGGRDLWLVRTDSTGSVLWDKTFGGTGDEKGWSLVRTADGGFLMAGSTVPLGGDAESTETYLVKVDASGEEIWTQTYNFPMEDRARCAIQTTDGGFAITGWIYVSDIQHSDAYVIKTDAAGDVTWSRTYGGSYEDLGNSIRQIPGGGFVVAGLSQAAPTDENAWLLKLSSDGTQEWSRTYFGPDYPDYASCVVPTADGGYAVAGYTHSWGAGGDAWLIRTRDDGTEQWNRIYGGEVYDFADCILAMADGGFLLSGMTRSHARFNQAWLLRTDASGVEQWERMFGGEGDERGASVQPTTDGGFIMAGSTTDAPGGLNAYLVYFKP